MGLMLQGLEVLAAHVVSLDGLSASYDCGLRSPTVDQVRVATVANSHSSRAARRTRDTDDRSLESELPLDLCPSNIAASPLD
jgi:hypothetical protein